MKKGLSRVTHFSNSEFGNINKWSHGRTIHPYLRAAFWVNPANWFWETEAYTLTAKAYFRNMIAEMKSDRHNQVKIENAQI